MKNIFKKTLLTLAILLASLATVQITAHATTYATGESREPGDCSYLLGMPSWDCHINPNPGDQNELTSNIIIIISNVLTAITVASAYLVLGFVIYGGYLYMFSSGDPTKAATSRKVLTRAFIGLAIVLLSNIILNAIRFALIQNSSLATYNTTLTPETAGNIFTNAVNWIIGISGVVSLVFIVIGAVGYITSAGDPSKLQKAKNTLTYALIGLAIVVLSAVITAAISNLIRKAENEAFNQINQTIIAKELYEK